MTARKATGKPEKPSLAEGSRLKPVRIIAIVKQGKHAVQVWDCLCECGREWAAKREHLQCGREMMCGTCKGPMKRRGPRNVQ